LLTDEDLTRLDHYIQAKNRLHNRFLHGWGVACGLEVVCGVCGPDHGQVIVKPGYALSPCGNDIIVCKTEAVDVCDLISRCRPPMDDCHDLFAQPAPQPNPNDPAGVPGNRECPGEDWVLAICYTEKPARGVAALRAQPPEPSCGCGGSGKSDCGCGCTGGSGRSNGHAHASGGCGCGCGGHGGKRKSPVAASRSLPEQCEPTVTCEGYRFVVYKPEKNANQRDYGAAERRFLCCIAPLIREVPGGINGVLNVQQGVDWVVAFRDAVRHFVVNEGLYDCEIADKLAAIVIPSVAGRPLDDALNDLNKAALSIADIGALALQKCFCAALLPPCPEPSQNDCVPLATLTMAAGKCRVKKICNIGARKFLVTIPNIEYWLSFIANVNPLIKFLEKICCEFDPADWKQNGVDFFKRMGDEIEHRIDVKGTPWPLFWQSLNAPSHMFTLEHLLLGVLGARNDQGQPFANDNELAHPTEAVLFNQVLAPYVRTFVADAPAGSVPSGDLHDLGRQLADLRDTLKAQQRTIDKQQRTINELKRDR
jgi:hypothetical protein